LKGIKVNAGKRDRDKIGGAGYGFVRSNRAIWVTGEFG
jgi:hypothetical protein